MHAAIRLCRTLAVSRRVEQPLAELLPVVWPLLVAGPLRERLLLRPAAAEQGRRSSLRRDQDRDPPSSASAGFGEVRTPAGFDQTVSLRRSWLWRWGNGNYRRCRLKMGRSARHRLRNQTTWPAVLLPRSRRLSRCWSPAATLYPGCPRAPPRPRGGQPRRSIWRSLKLMLAAPAARRYPL